MKTKQKYLINEALVLARGFNNKREAEKDLYVNRPVLLKRFESEKIPFSVINADFAYIHEKGFCGDQIICEDLYLLAMEDILQNKKCPDNLTLRFKDGTEIATAPIKRLDMYSVDKVLNYSSKVFDRKTKGIRTAHQNLYQRYIHTFGGFFDKSTTEIGRSSYRLGILLHLIGERKTPESIVEQYLRKLGYNVELHNLCREIEGWKKEPKDLLLDPRLLLTISIAPEIFGTTQRKGYNLVRKGTKISNFIVSDVKKRNMNLERRIAIAKFSSPINKNMFRKRKLAGDILRTVIECLE